MKNALKTIWMAGPFWWLCIDVQFSANDGDDPNIFPQNYPSPLIPRLFFLFEQMRTSIAIDWIIILSCWLYGCNVNETLIVLLIMNCIYTDLMLKRLNKSEGAATSHHNPRDLNDRRGTSALYTPWYSNGRIITCWL